MRSDLFVGLMQGTGKIDLALVLEEIALNLGVRPIILQLPTWKWAQLQEIKIEVPDCN